MKLSAYAIFGIVSLVCSVAAFTLWPFFQGNGWCFSSKADALGFFFLALSAFLAKPKCWAYQIILAATTIRLTDELAFNPMVIEYKEFILFGLIILGIAIYNIGYYVTTKQNP